MAALFFIWIFGSPILLLIGIILACIEKTRKTGLRMILAAFALALIGLSVCSTYC